MAKPKVRAPVEDYSDMRREYERDGNTSRFLRIADRKFTIAVVGFTHGGKLKGWCKTVTHYSASQQKSFPCGDAQGKSCRYCQDGQRPRAQYMMNVYHVEAEAFGVYQAPASVWDPIAKVLTDAKTRNGLSGLTFHVIKTGTGLKTQYAVTQGKTIKLPAGLTPIDCIDLWSKQQLRQAEQGALRGGGGGKRKRN